MGLLGGLVGKLERHMSGSVTRRLSARASARGLITSPFTAHRPHRWSLPAETSEWTG